MKPSATQDKSQRSIASFFFKPKAGATPKTGPASQQRVLGEKQAAQGPPLLAPGKRQRVVPPETQRQEDALPPDRSSSPTLRSQAGKFSAVQPPSAATANVQSAHTSGGSTPQPAGNTHTSQTPVPARIEHRHQRFQQKLVIGAGNKPEGPARGMPAVTKPKYTPLELQIVELKDKHPGVLLIVEVTKFIWLYSYCTQYLLTSGKAAWYQQLLCKHFSYFTNFERALDNPNVLHPASVCYRLGTKCASLGKMQVGRVLWSQISLLHQGPCLTPGFALQTLHPRSATFLPILITIS